MPVEEIFKEISTCPKCRGALEYNEDRDAFLCRPCSLMYEVHDGIPNFIIEEAKELESHE